MRTRCLAVAMALAAASPASASEIWHCVVKNPAGRQGAPLRATARISGENLYWVAKGPVINSRDQILRLPNGKMRLRTQTTHYRVLQNSDAGTVAYRDPQPKSNVLVTVIFIDKTGGGLRIESFFAGWNITGHCTLAAKPKSP